MGLDKKALQGIVKEEERLIFDSIEDKYLSDVFGRKKGHADALIFVKSTAEVSEIIRYANANKIPITPRGAGTNLVGSTVPICGGIILDFSLMNHILEIDKYTMTACVEPGILLSDFQAVIGKEGLFYPPDPGEKESSIGGNISTNAGGMRAVKYGVTRDYVRGLELVLADGSIVNVGSKNVKDASGLSFKHLIIGAEGTLAVITKCILKLLPQPEHSQSVLVPYVNLEDGIQSVLKILQTNANPTALEFMERKVVTLGEKFTGITYPCQEAGSYILLTFDGSKEEIDAKINTVKELAMANGAIDYIVLNKKLSEEIWKVRGALVNAVEEISEQEPVDVVVPINRTAEFIQFVNELEKSSGMQMICFGHAGDGNIHLCLLRDKREEEAWVSERHHNLKKIYRKASELNGLVSGEHGIGLSKRTYFFKETAKENLVIMNKIKNALDPLHIFNDHKAYIE